MSLAQAREWALANKLAVRKGIDPFTAQRSSVPTFAVACRRAAEAAPLTAANEVGRRAALVRYCGPIMGRRLDAIRRGDVIAILAPVMAERPALGSKLKGWIRGAFAWGVAREHLGNNPADGIGRGIAVGEGKAPSRGLAVHGGRQRAGQARRKRDQPDREAGDSVPGAHGGALRRGAGRDVG